MTLSRASIWVPALAALAIGCSSEPRNTEEPLNTSEPTTTTTAPTEPVTTADTAAPEPAGPPVDIVAGKPADPPPKAPTISIKAPTANQVVPADKAGDFEVKLDLKGWDVPAGGNHVHVIMDNKPYKRIDDAKAPIKLSDLAGGAPSEGQHVIVAFPSRHTHESVKPVGKVAPLAVVSFWVGKKGEASWKPTDPTFIFSRPKGANDGPPPPEGILIDWYLANVELGEGKYSIDALLVGPGVDTGKKVSIKSWGPWRMTNPRDGSYKLRMILNDKDGKPVPGAWNDTTREFTVNSKAPPPANHPPHPAAPPDSKTGEAKGPPAKEPPPAKAPPPAKEPPAKAPPAEKKPEPKK